MAEEIQEAVQIIRVAYDGIDIAMKIGSGTLGQVKKAFDLIVALLDREKLAGKTNMRKLLLRPAGAAVCHGRPETGGKACEKIWDTLQFPAGYQQKGRHERDSFPYGGCPAGEHDAAENKDGQDCHH